MKNKTKQPDLLTKPFCKLSNPCGKTVCCALCDETKCVERCHDDNLYCKWATRQEKANTAVKTNVLKGAEIKPWNKDKVTAT